MIVGATLETAWDEPYDAGSFALYMWLHGLAHFVFPTEKRAGNFCFAFRPCGLRLPLQAPGLNARLMKFPGAAQPLRRPASAWASEFREPSPADCFATWHRGGVELRHPTIHIPQRYSDIRLATAPCPAASPVRIYFPDLPPADPGGWGPPVSNPAGIQLLLGRRRRRLLARTARGVPLRRQPAHWSSILTGVALRGASPARMEVPRCCI